ncbi:ankyrin repeat domain-containing protein [Euzebyella marina]|uniref:Ankyrin repeat domain-containing protein n=1 Tax=Euzebyella marina TaxID=1761453 RepID=A0A3G2L3V2_9FLAO|nr:ankyrin repeat domain-containing protein [Euzebyella marina]AYN66957.1 ankyrin repeat domain-containing protein [Euzebyella marina]
MKKTVFSTALFCLAISFGIQAAEPTSEISTAKIENLKSLDVSSFCKAIMQGDIDTVKKLIDLGEDVNQKSLGMTPAIYAARYNKPEILQLLIDNGANLKIKSDKGYSVKKYAELSNAVEALQVLETAMGS